jgi:hypothetical protein
MNPNLQFAQAIHGRFTGQVSASSTRFTLLVAQAVNILEDSRALTTTDLGGVTRWFIDYLKWMTTTKWTG